ncbi:MAG TPA: response regulator transcription factor [Kiritimatiellia bacterium]|nr:response regulator transcription factor [Kiritimatiellia bacterium]HMP00009.1 response regulator transcription factor [Kiritimatiellia bacterium]HMP98025.1 response regulator transcription factor [Kiritimatiellia bacterium]
MMHDKEKKKNILIVDDHPLVRKGIRSLLEQEHDFKIAGEAGSRSEVLEHLRRNIPDLILLDISLQGSDGIEVTKAIRCEFDRIPILIVSMHDETLYAERALRAGANGYIMKQEVAENVIKAIRQVLSGKIYVSDGMRQKVLRDLTQPHADIKSTPMERLSDRELEVFRLIGEGRGTREIAESLHLSIKTIETYRAHIKEKLSIKSAAELARAAVNWVESARHPS